MITKSDSYNRILEKYDDLPKQQKKIADYIISRYDEVVFFLLQNYHLHYRIIAVQNKYY